MCLLFGRNQVGDLELTGGDQLPKTGKLLMTSSQLMTTRDNSTDLIQSDIDPYETDHRRFARRIDVVACG